MGAIDGASSSSGNTTSLAQTMTNGKKMGRDTFLKLLVTQMKNQDPLKPLENTEFTAQLAQFSSLDQLFDVNNNLGVLQDSQNIAINSSFSNMLGKKIEAAGNTFNLTAGQTQDITFQLAGDADKVIVDVVNRAGEPVAKMISREMSEGINTIMWDGLDFDGNLLDSGKYYFYMDAKDVEGENVESSPFLTGVISGISYEGDQPSLIVDDAKISMEDVYRIYE